MHASARPGARGCVYRSGWLAPPTPGPLPSGHRTVARPEDASAELERQRQRGAVSEVELQSRRVHVRGGTGMLALACRGLGQTNLRVIGTSRDHVLGQPPANSAPLIGEPPRHRRNSASHAPSADLIGGIPPPTRLSHADLICGIPHPTRLSHDFCRGRIQRNCGIPHPQKGPKWLRVWKARPFFFDGSAIF